MKLELKTPMVRTITPNGITLREPNRSNNQPTRGPQALKTSMLMEYAAAVLALLQWNSSKIAKEPLVDPPTANVREEIPTTTQP
jgi:hypothetical protein|tara:strand:+ start:19951 stop:20202 length:252 start_codon:yes stop_codon:yes gene_type:complete